MTVDVALTGPDDIADREAFVRDAPDATFFQRPDWLAVHQACFPYKDRSLIARDGGRIVGVLPLMSIHSPLTGRALISTPMGISAGPLADSPDVARSLVRGAVDYAATFGAKYLEIRDVADGLLDTLGPWHAPDNFAIFEQDLAGSAEAALQAVPRKQRAEVRRGIKAGLTAKADNDLDAFYPLHCLTVRGHGTPPMPKRYFQALLDRFGGEAEILTVRSGGRPVCGVFCFYHRSTVLPYYAGAANTARGLGGFAFMYWSLMGHAIDKGMTRFNFGRSFIGSGAYDFKRNFGFEPRPARYRFHARRPEDLPDLHPDNPRLKPILAVWRRLPLPVTVLLGSRLAWLAP